jgi:hypothetical protein
MQRGYLFSGEQVDLYVGLRMKELSGSINAVKDLAALTDRAAKYGDKARIEPCVVDRKSTTFDVKEIATAITVTASIPVTGDLALLTVRVPRGSGETILVRGDRDYGTAWPGEKKSEPHVAIVESFDPGTSSEDVRAKVKISVDAIEKNLSLINAFVEQHNAAIDSEVGRLVAQRRQVLETGSTLRDDLGGGI